MTAPTLGLAEAAKACGVSESTIRRRRAELLAMGATQTNKGWQIPIPVLIQAGLMANTTPATEETPESPAPDRVEPLPTAPDESLRQQLEALRKALGEAETRAAVAEAVAQERERIIRVQEQALRMLGPAAEHTAPATVQEEPAQQPAAAGVAVQEQPPRRSWWQRIRG